MKKLLGIVGLSVALLSGCGDTEEPKQNQNYCPSRFSGVNCDQCTGHYTGPNCDQCEKHFTGVYCDQCIEGYYGMNCIEYGQFIDPRDGNSYKTITHDDQTWMAENLRYDGVEHYSANGDSLNDAKYGYLYTWENALKACPSGWHLPTVDEFNHFLYNTNGNNNPSNLIDRSWENGSNWSGFSALPAGDRFINDDFNYFGSLTYYWSSTPFDNWEYAYCLSVFILHAEMDQRCSRVVAYSVRCIQDSN